MNKRAKLTITLALLAGLLFYMVFFLSGYYAGLFIDSYGREFNPRRKQLGIPLIEAYFILKETGSNGTQIWITPDSIKASKFHLSKEYSIDLSGNIVYEADRFCPQLTNEWVRLMHFDTLDYEIINGGKNTFSQPNLRRTYFFRNDSVSYEMEIVVSSEELLDKKLSRHIGDSILNAQIR